MPEHADYARGEPEVEGADHQHEWRYVRTFENYWDGDEEDLYECACGAKDRRYIPR